MRALILILSISVIYIIQLINIKGGSLNTIVTLYCVLNFLNKFFCRIRFIVLRISKVLLIFLGIGNQIILISLVISNSYPIVVYIYCIAICLGKRLIILGFQYSANKIRCMSAILCDILMIVL